MSIFVRTLLFDLRWKWNIASLLDRVKLADARPIVYMLQHAYERFCSTMLPRRVSRRRPHKKPNIVRNRT